MVYTVFAEMERIWIASGVRALLLLYARNIARVRLDRVHDKVF